MNLIAVLIALAIIIVTFKFNVFLGIAVAIVAIGVGIYNFLPTYYAINGNKAFEIGDEDRAREWYKKACETGRANVKLKSSYAYVLLRTGYADEAEKVLDPIIRVKGLAPEKKNLAKQQRCMVYYKQGRLDEAIEDAQSMMNEGYRNSSIYGMLGYFKLLRNDDLDETTKLCEEAYDYNSDDRDIKDNLSICYFRKGEYEKLWMLTQQFPPSAPLPDKKSDELVGSAPNFVEGFYHGIQIAMKLNKYDKAAEYAEKLKECKRSGMTTVTEEEVNKLIQEVKNHNENTIG